MKIVQLAIDVPLPRLFDYLAEDYNESNIGYRALVPFGRGSRVGVVVGVCEVSDQPPEKLKPVTAILRDMPPLPPAWRALCEFCARYYQAPLGEVMAFALPPMLRRGKLPQRRKAGVGAVPPAPTFDGALPILLATQQAAVNALVGCDSFQTFLLHGVTGSGKTEVYLRAIDAVLGRGGQALMLVPEIALTPQLEGRVAARFPAAHIVSAHSGVPDAARARGFLDALEGRADIVLGTRLSVFMPLPRLQLIVVDEEHDGSFKQQDGLRYSARDVAIWRAHQHDIPIVLGSATPSLESWHLSRPAAEGGRYLRLLMPGRVGQTDKLPLVRRVDMNHQPRNAVFSIPLLAAIRERIERGEQCMVFLNRRGYAPVLHCGDCGWKSECPHCSAYRVFHKIDRTLRCHHCGFTERVPRACPACGNPDISPIGRGTERLEEHLAELLSEVRRPNSITAECPTGESVRIARIDADTTRLKGALESQLAAVHSGDVDVLVGTQMIAKGHDFRRITLVAAVHPDGALFSSDFRAPERLFGLLLQAAGRSGRDASLGANAEMWVQTFQPAHPLYAALKGHDYPAFAQQQLQERAQAGLPPFSAQALVRAEAKSQEAANSFLETVRLAASDMAYWDGWADIVAQVTVYPAIPMGIQRIANIERAQMLVESPSRAALQKFLSGWQSVLHTTRQGPAGKGVIRWAVDVDPLAI